MDKFKKAVNRVIFEHPFFATVLLQLEHKQCAATETMSTDGYTLRYGASFVNELDAKEVVGVLLHECMHTVLGHPALMLELQQKDPTFNVNIFQLAMDFVINNILTIDKITLPSGCTPDVWDRLVAQAGITCPPLIDMTSQQVYDIMMGMKQKGMNLPDHDDPIVIPAEGDVATAQADAQTLMAQAMAAGRQAGNMPGGLEEMLGALRAVQVDWRRELWEFVQSLRHSEYTFTRRNRRYLTSNIAMPSFGGKGMPALNLIYDSSGSVSGEEFTQYVSEMNAAVQALNIPDVISVVCDTQVQAVHHHSVSDGEVVFNNVGRGGTVMEPAFEELEKYRPAPTILFSDGYFSVPKQPDYPVLWCFSTDHPAPPYGKTVRVSVKG